MHVLESLVDLTKRAAVGDELVDLDLSLHVVVNDSRKLGAALDTAKGAALPDTASDKLERTGGDLLASGSNTDDDRLTPTLVAGLEGRAHDMDVSSGIEGEVKTTVSELNKFLLDGSAHVLGVDEVSSTELPGPGLLLVVNVNDIDLASLAGSSTLNNGQTDAASTEDSDIVTLLDVGGDGGSTISGGDTTAQQTGSVHRSGLIDGNH